MIGVLHVSRHVLLGPQGELKTKRAEQRVRPTVPLRSARVPEPSGPLAWVSGSYYLGHGFGLICPVTLNKSPFPASFFYLKRTLLHNDE